jgi:hypothetical protein
MPGRAEAASQSRASNAVVGRPLDHLIERSYAGLRTKIEPVVAISAKPKLPVVANVAEAIAVFVPVGVAHA